MSESILKQIMAEFDAAKEDGGWDEGHPIFQMAEDIDASHKRIAELEAAGRSLISEIGEGSYDDWPEPHKEALKFNDQLSQQPASGAIDEPKKYKGITCRGCWEIGNNCKTCERCIDTKPVSQ